MNRVSKIEEGIENNRTNNTFKTESWIPIKNNNNNLQCNIVIIFYYFRNYLKLIARVLSTLDHSLRIGTL